MKNKLLAVILFIAMLIPTVVAVVYYNKQQIGPVDSRTAVSMTIDDLSGNSFKFDKEADSKTAEEMINFFLTMNNNAASIVSLPAPLLGADFFKVVISNKVRNIEFQYYFSKDPNEAYYVNQDGASFQIRVEDAEKFLKSEYAASLYEESTLPVLTLSNQYKVAPATATWNYINYTGEFVSANTSAAVSVQNGDFMLEGGIGLDFSIEPDYFFVTVTSLESKEVMFSDIYENISALVINSNTEVNIKIEAKWYNEESRKYNGELTYSFKATVSAPAAFYAGVTSLSLGEFVCITGENISNKDIIEFKSEPDINFTPKFFNDGDYVRALIPFSYDLKAGSYDLTFVYGGTKQTMTIDVSDRSVRSFPFAADKATVESYYTDETVEAFEKAMADVFTSADEARYWEGSFHRGVDSNVPVSVGFAHLYQISSTNKVFKHNGIDFACPEGTNVYALNKGKVIYSGYLDYTGNIVVIEHGYGLKSYYAHLKDIKVKVGDMVNNGAVIGSAGRTGFAKGNGVHISMSVFSVPVSPYKLWVDGDWKTVPIYKG